MNKRVKHLFAQNLIQYFSENKKCDEPLVISVPGTIDFEEEAAEVSEGLLPIKAKAYHDSKNANGSVIDSVVFVERTKTCEFKPLLGHIIVNEDGIKDFGGHDYKFVESEDEETDIKYLEQPVGVLTGEFAFEYDEDQEVNRAILDGYIYEEYCSDAVEIIQRRDGKVDCSIELFVNKQHYDRKKKLLFLDDYCIMGLTLLGEDKNPGMIGSEVTLTDFNQDKIDDSTEGQNDGLFNLDKSTEKGGKAVGKITYTFGDQTFEKTLEKSIQEVFDAFYGVFRNKGFDYVIYEVYENYAIVGPWTGDKFFKAPYSRNENDEVVPSDSFVEVERVWEEVSENIEPEEPEAFEGDPEETEKAESEEVPESPEEAEKEETEEPEEDFELKAVKSELETAKAELAEYKLKEERIEKMKLIEDAPYKQFMGNDAFKNLIADVDKYSVEDFKIQAKLAFADCSMESSPQPEQKNTSVVPFEACKKKKKPKRRYGKLFDR